MGQSDLAFRLFVRAHGADVAFTPMFLADRFAVDEEYRQQYFQTCAADHPLIIQFAGHQPETFAASAALIADRVDAIDINLGCPQLHAKQQRYGAYLTHDRVTIRQIITALLHSTHLPITVKIRLLPTLEETIRFCLFLVDCGVAMISIHGRQRGSTKTGRRRQGAANLQWIKQCAEAIKAYCPAVAVIANGNIRCHQDLLANLHTTHCDGVMSAEALLHNPTLFQTPTSATSSASASLSSFQLCLKYLSYCRSFPPPAFSWIQDHCWNILRPSAKEQHQLYCSIKQSIRGSEMKDLQQMEEWIHRWDQQENDRMNSEGQGSVLVSESTSAVCADSVYCSDDCFSLSLFVLEAQSCS